MTFRSSWVVGAGVDRCRRGWCRAGVLDEDGALELGDSDRVAVLDDEDLLPGALSVDHVGALAQAYRTVGAWLHHARVVVERRRQLHRRVRGFVGWPGLVGLRARLLGFRRRLPTRRVVSPFRAGPGGGVLANDHR